jgi:hypothetical protein
MATLHENTLKFNQKMTVTNTGGNLSTDAGLVLVKEFLYSIGFEQLMEKELHFQDSRLLPTHSNETILEQLIFQLIAGYDTDASANILRQDPFFQQMLEKSTLASQPSLSRFWDRISESPDALVQLQALNQAMLDKVRIQRNATEMVLDLDSTYSDTYGNQEETAFNRHYQTTGYHPLVAFDGLTKDFLKAELRSGNTYCSTGAADFLNPLLEHYNQTVPVSTILVRADSGFAAPELYDLCEEKEHQYVIRLKRNRRLFKMAEEFVQVGDETEWSQKEEYFYSIRYQAGTWKHDRRVCIRSVRAADELIFHHEFIITILSDAVSTEQVYQTYWKRGTMENFIKEAKNGFFFDKTDSSHFLENAVRMMVSLLSYNINNFMRTLAFPEKAKGLQIQSIRLRFFKIAGKLIHSGRRMMLKLSTHHVYQDEFFHILRQIQSLSW